METKKAYEYTFVNYPEQRTREDYAMAIRKIVELHKGMEEVIALYRFGSISTPGISDIDYFVVTKGKDRSFRYKCQHDKLTEKEKYFFQHYPSAIVPQWILPQLHLLAPFFEIECIYKREGYTSDIPSIEISKEEAQMFLADVIFMAYPRVFIEILNKPGIDVQKALKVIHSLVHVVNLCGVLSIKKKRWKEYLTKGELLRDTWFEEKCRNTGEKKIISLLNEGFIVSLEIIESVSKSLMEKSGYQPKISTSNEHVYFITRNFGVIFQENYDGEEEKKKMTLEEVGKDTVISFLPLIFAEHIKQYTMTDTLFGNYVKKRLNYHYDEKTEICQDSIKKERCIVMSELLRYTIAINYKLGTFTPFNLNFLSHYGYINVIYDMIWWFLYKDKINRIVVKSFKK